MGRTEIKRRFKEFSFDEDSEFLKRRLVDKVMPLAEEEKKKVIEGIKNGKPEYIKKYGIKSRQKRFYIVFDGIFASKPVDEIKKYKEEIAKIDGKVVREEEMLFDDEGKPYVGLTYYKPPRDYGEVKFTVELACYGKYIGKFILERYRYPIKERELYPRPLDENLVVAFLEGKIGVSILALQGLGIDVI